MRTKWYKNRLQWLLHGYVLRIRSYRGKPRRVSYYEQLWIRQFLKALIRDDRKQNPDQNFWRRLRSAYWLMRDTRHQTGKKQGLSGFWRAYTALEEQWLEVMARRYPVDPAQLNFITELLQADPSRPQPQPPSDEAPNRPQP